MPLIKQRYFYSPRKIWMQTLHFYVTVSGRRKRNDISKFCEKAKESCDVVETLIINY